MIILWLHVEKRMHVQFSQYSIEVFVIENCIFCILKALFLNSYAFHMFNYSYELNYTKAYTVM